MASTVPTEERGVTDDKPKKWNPGLYSSATDEWATPQAVFDYLDSIFSFTLDPCASPDNAKCERYFTVEQDGLLQSWQGERVFVNPPYGTAIADWLRKGYREARGGALVVFLVPARTDTRWWHDYAIKGEVHLLRGRLKYNDGDDSAPFPSAVVVFYPNGILATYEAIDEPLFGRSAE
jgi:site-specific DNA-methyltransferase (adenine-specific)